MNGDRFKYRKFWEYLPWGRKKRNHKYGRKVHTDFKTVTQEEIDECVEEINSRPRKCLGYFTPNDVFLGKLNCSRVAIQSGM